MRLVPLRPRAGLSLALSVSLLAAEPLAFGPFVPVAPATVCIQEVGAPEGPAEDDPYRPGQTEFALEHTFERPLLPPRGYESLEDMRGQPVVFVYWWMESVEAAERLQETMAWLEPYLGSVEVLFCEGSRASDAEVERYVWDRGLWNPACSFTREAAVPRKVWHPFHLLLLDADGRVAWWGPLYGREQERAEALEALVAQARIPSDVTDEKLLDAWETFRSGDWSAAQRMAEKARKQGEKEIEKGRTGATGEHSVYHQAGFLMIEIESATKRYADRGLALLERGHPLEAKALLEELQDLDPPETRACELQVERLEEPFEAYTMRALLERAEVLAEIEARAAGDPETGGNLGAQRQDLVTFLDGPDDALAERARRLLDLLDS